jgi:hypothetical protein
MARVSHSCGRRRVPVPAPGPAGSWPGKLAAVLAAGGRCSPVSMPVDAFFGDEHQDAARVGVHGCSCTASSRPPFNDGCWLPIIAHCHVDMPHRLPFDMLRFGLARRFHAQVRHHTTRPGLPCIAACFPPPSPSPSPACLPSPPAPRRPRPARPPRRSHHPAAARRDADPLRHLADPGRRPPASAPGPSSPSTSTRPPTASP